LQGVVANEGDGWTWTAEELERFYEHQAHKTVPDLESDAARDAVGAYLEAARTLGRRTAELHVALSVGEDPAFSPEEFTNADIEGMASQIRSEASRTFELLKGSLPVLPDDSLEMAGQALRQRRSIVDKLHLPADRNYGKRIRVHGDYHLGQVLHTKNDFVIVDFEGEPARPLEQRRAKSSPLKDVAGMMRSFSYAANSALMHYAARRPEDFASLQPWAQLWEATVASEFIASYLAVAEVRRMLPAADEDVYRLLDAYRLEKAMYELRYELNNRPDWVRIPLAGILALDRV
jgi:maltose alpha-D-glucosyltransferase/alpha-amylase